MTSMTHRATENDACTGIGYFNDNISIIHFTNMESSINQELMAQPQTKRCPRCGRTLTVEHFSRHGKSKDGLQTYCKECHRAMCAKTNDKRIGGIYPPPVKGDPNSPLGNFTPRELLEELQRRGFHGEFQYTYNIKI